MNFPHPFVPDLNMRAGRMMAAGRVKITARNLTSGEHITILLKAIADNRKRQYKSDDHANWIPCPLRDATHVFAEVPNQSEWNDKVGTYYPKTGRWFDADNADPERVRVAKAVAKWVMTGYEGELLYEGPLEFLEANECGVCGRELTDPESIKLGIGPVCYGRLTNSQHQVKQKDLTPSAMQIAGLEAYAPGADAMDQFIAENPNGDGEVFENQSAWKRNEIIENLRFLSNEDLASVKREVDALVVDRARTRYASAIEDAAEQVKAASGRGFMAR